MSFTKFSVLALALATSVSAGLIVRQEEGAPAANSTAGDTALSFNEEGDLVFDYPSGSLTLGVFSENSTCRESACGPFIAQLPATCDSQNCVFIPCTTEGLANLNACVQCEFDALPADLPEQDRADAQEQFDIITAGMAEGCATAGTPLTPGTETNDEASAPEDEEETPGNGSEKKPAEEKPAGDNNAAEQEADNDSGALRVGSVIGAVAGALGAVMIAL